MNKFFKYGLIGFGGIFAAYFSYDLIDTLNKESIRAAKLVKTNAENDRIEVVQLKLAESFAECAASSLKPQYLQDFIVYEVMPLGIAWQLATKRETEHPLDLTQDPNPISLLNDHFRRTLSFALQAEYEKNSSLKREHFRSLANGIESKFNPSLHAPYPTIFVYKSTKATRLKDTKPSDIEIGTMNIGWPKFEALAVRCKATPYDLDLLTRNQNLPPEHKTEDEVESARVSSMGYGSDDRYLKQKRMYWKSLTLTPEYKVAYAKIKVKNLSIMNAIVAEHEPKELEKKKIQKEAGNVIFKTP